MSVNEIIKRLRIDRELTQNDLAEMMNCNRQKIADWERGKSTPSADDITLLSKKFNVSADYLLGLSNTPTTDKDIKFICNYTGLDEKSIQSIKIKDNIMMGTSFPTEFLRTGFLVKKYTEFYKEILNEFLQSSCLLDVVANCCYEKIIEYSINKMIELKNQSVDNLSENDKDMLFELAEIAVNYDTQHKLNLFNIQDSVLDFAKSLTDIQNMNDYDIEEAAKEIIITDNKKDGENNADNTQT